jgi:ubiquinone/menaquinone biosynthesis C-methylase UbiE
MLKHKKTTRTKISAPLKVWMEVTGKNLSGDNEIFDYSKLTRLVVNSEKSLDSMLKKLPEKPKVVADIGAGYGTVSLSLAKKGFEVYAIEPSSEERAIIKHLLAKHSRYKSKIKVINGNAESLTLRDNSVDLCILSQVLEHVQSPSKTFKEISRVLKKGGNLYLCSPNYFFPVEQHYGLIYFPLMRKRLFSIWAMFLFKTLNIRGLEDTKNADFSKVESFIYTINYTTDLMINNFVKKYGMKIVWSASSNDRDLIGQVKKHWNQNPGPFQAVFILISMPKKFFRWSMANFGFLPMKLEYLIQNDS